MNSRLLDRLTRENRGQSQYVRPDEDLEEHVSRLYSKISAPVLTDVKIEYDMDTDHDGSPVNRVYPAEVLDLFAGQQLVLVGRYRESGPAKMKISGRLGEEKLTFDYDITFSKKSDDSQYAFTARLWAIRRIGEIIDLIDLEGKNQELVDELVHLAREHGILTPYTSYLADDLASPNQLSDAEFQREWTEQHLYMLEEATDGQFGFAQRGFKQHLRMAPNAALPEGLSPDASGGGLVQRGGAGGGLGGFGGQLAGEAPDMGGGGRIQEQRMQMGNFRSPDSQGDAGSSENAPTNRPVDEVIRQAGTETAYLRGNVLIAANAVDVDLEKQKEEIVEIERYSDEYFELLKSTSQPENQLLALQQPNEEMVVRLQGKIYRIR